MDSTEESSNQSVYVTFDSKPAMPVLQNAPQIDTLDFRPGTVSEQAVGNIITGITARTGKITLVNSTTNVTTVTLTDINNRLMVAPAEADIFINGSDHWPTANYAMGNMPVSVFNNFGLSDGTNIVTTVAVRNNSGSDVQAVITCYYRVITNNSSDPNLVAGSVSGV